MRLADGDANRAGKTPRIRHEHLVIEFLGEGREHLLCAKLHYYQTNDMPDLGTRGEGSGEGR